MNRAQSRPFISRKFCALVILSLLLLSACGKSKKPIIVGSMNGTEQTILGEIVARHLESRLQRKVQRRLAMGGELLAYQSLEGGEISLYPDYTGSVDAILLKETPSSDPTILLERTRSEMARIARIEVLDPLGYSNATTVVVRSADADQAKVRTLSQAAAGATRWKLGVSFEFQQSGSDMPALASYKIPLAQSVRGVEGSQLFPMLTNGDLTMIATTATEARLTSPDFRSLEDDRHLFPPQQACLLVRQDSLADDPQIRAALNQLSGKFTLDGVRKMDAEVDLSHRSPADVAAEFLASAGLQ